jgi:hypothetical protein
MPSELQLLIEGMALRRPPSTIATVHRQAAEGGPGAGVAGAGPPVGARRAGVEDLAGQPAPGLAPAVCRGTSRTAGSSGPRIGKGQRSADPSLATSPEEAPGVLPCQQIPAVPITVRPSAACQPRPPQAIPSALVTIVTATSQQTRSQRPGSPAAGSARCPGAPASTCDVRATECPDRGGSNHGAESSGWAPDQRDCARVAMPSTDHGA